MTLATQSDAVAVLRRAWPMIAEECRSVLAGELHYQAVVYHCLRMVGVPRAQLGMNVKQYITNPASRLFQTFVLRHHPNFTGGFEPIPDVALFRADISGNWQRRNCDLTLRHMLLAIEIKASERQDGRLRQGEVISDIRKLAAHREEALHSGAGFYPVMAVVDVAMERTERMTLSSLEASRNAAAAAQVGWLYLSPSTEEVALPDVLPD